MMYTTILLSTSTEAQSARRSLAAVNIPASVKKITEGRRGCRFGLLIPTKYFYTAVAELRRRNIPFEIRHDR